MNMMKRALLVGINNYRKSPLNGCIEDATRLAEILEFHYDGSPNFATKLYIGPPETITKASLREAIDTLFKQPADLALFYFSGHGKNINVLGGHLVTPDTQKYDEGVPMKDLLTFANKSPVKEIVIILDCCDSGAISGQSTDIDLREGISILTASGRTEAAVETPNGGIFTGLVCDALMGGASDVRGEVNAASVYSFCDQSLNAWSQRPRFISHVDQLTELRLCEPHVDFKILRLITKYFLHPESEYQLGPSYEWDKRDVEDKTVNKEHEEIFGHLQAYRDAHLLVPFGEKHMYYAAIRSKSCKLTRLGQLYWKLVKAKRI